MPRLAGAGMTKPIAVELFCGVGGMTLGFEQAGFNVVAAFDSDKRNVEFHKLNFPHSQTFDNDISKLTGEEVLRLTKSQADSIDLLFGGPPCQGFSVIGRRREGDKRNLLILHFARLVRELRPKYFVVENVRGLLYAYSKKTLKSFLQRVRRSGYEVVEPIITLDATEYGVPQKRHRAFILGYRKGSTPPAYPLPLSNPDERLLSPTVNDAIGDLPDITAFDELLTNDRYVGELGTPSKYATALRLPPTNGYPKRADWLSGCMRTIHTQKTKKAFAATTPGTYERKSRCYRLKSDGISFTLRAGSDVNNGSFTAARPIHPNQPRCITTREAARLHSFPDWFQFHPTKWHGFRQVGNAVPPLLAQAVAASVFNAIKGKNALK
jgi:DNA (cytosine-5)-methyltransferase 1